MLKIVVIVFVSEHILVESFMLLCSRKSKDKLSGSNYKGKIINVTVKIMKPIITNNCWVKSAKHYHPSQLSKGEFKNKTIGLVLLWLIFYQNRLR